MKFNFQELASAGSGYLFDVSKTDNGIGGVYKVFNFMINENLFTHQLPSAFKLCQPVIIAQHPWIKELTNAIEYMKQRCTNAGYLKEFDALRKRYIAEYGDEFELISMSDWKNND